ncbi:MAG TPA: hypothetical protein VGH02_13390 [Rhizomicrobium sp.]|jgi:hypothetical protein
MTRTTLLLPLAASLMLGTAAFAQEQPSNQPMPQQQAAPPMQNDMAQADPRQSTKGGMPIDQETSVNGIPAACTGVADETENRARWGAYPVKIVLSGTTHQYFSGETVSVARSDGTQLAQMTCNGPWVLMKLEPGSYHATVDLPGHPTKTVAFTAPARGQREVNVVYTGAQETSDQTSAPRDQNRATSAGFIQPQSKPIDNTTTGNGAVDQPPMANPPARMDQSPNNSDQPTQPQ